MAPKIDAESMKNKGCVADAFLERPLDEKGQRKCYGDGSFGDHFRPKLKKRHPKRHANFNAEKVLKFNAKKLPE